MMPTASYYMIYIKPQKGVNYNDVKKKMDLSIDWFNINENLWIAYTTSDKEKWYSRLKPLVGEDGYCFICRLDVTQRQGFMKKSFWKWLRREGTAEV